MISPVIRGLSTLYTTLSPLKISETFESRKYKITAEQVAKVYATHLFSSKSLLNFIKPPGIFIK